MRRSLATLATVMLAAASTACTTNQSHPPPCRGPYNNLLVLEAQAVPSAVLVPCVSSLPIGWRFGGWLIETGRATFWLDSDRAGIHAVEVALTRGCDISRAVEVQPAPGEVGVRVYQQPTSLPPAFAAVRSMVFPGGCIQYRFRFQRAAPPTLALEAIGSLGTVSRSVLVRQVERAVGLTLCGAEAPPCAG